MAAEGTFAGRSVPDPGFAGDDGSVSPALSDALGSGDPRAVGAALLTARVLVPVVAVLGEVEIGDDGLTREKTSDMAVVTVRAPSGRLALPAFSCTATLALWDPRARPVPVLGVIAARAALGEGADTLLLDPAGPARVALDGLVLRALAGGRAPLAPVEDPEVRAAVSAAARSVGIDLDEVSVTRGEAVDLVVRLTPRTTRTEADAARSAQALGAALAVDLVLRARLSRGLDLVVDRPDQA